MNWLRKILYLFTDVDEENITLKKELSDCRLNNSLFKEHFDKTVITLKEELNTLNLAYSVLQGKLKDKRKEDERAEYWNNKWKKNKIVYNAQGDIERDVRNLIATKSNILEPILYRFTGDDDYKIIQILKHVHNVIKYKGDRDTHKVAEFWQHPEETFQTCEGDCEDGALLIISLARMSGIPAYKIKLCAGWVQGKKDKAGHAYVIYLAGDNKWYPIDWCYWYSESLKQFKKVEHKERREYNPITNPIWWTCNDEYTWAQHITVI